MQEFKDKGVSYFLKGASLYIYRNSPFQCNNIAFFLPFVLIFRNIMNYSTYHAITRSIINTNISV